MPNLRASVLLVPLLCSACIIVHESDGTAWVNDRPVYTPPETSGLVGIRPFPTPADVCQVLGENSLTSEYLDDSATLIGCPQHERGAIRDRLAVGGRIVGYVDRWVLLSMPDGTYAQ